MSRWILSICCFFPFLGYSEITKQQSELVTIEQRIQTLKENLHQHRLAQIKEEVEGQELMIADWDAYSQKLELIRLQDEEEKRIEVEINKLEQQAKDLLLKSQPD